MKTTILSAGLLLSVMAAAQDSLHINRPVFLYCLATYDLPKGYGFTIGTSIPFHSVIKQRVPKDFKIHPEKDEFISAEVGVNRYPFAYTAIILSAGIGIRYIESAKHFTELSFNQGILRTVNDGKVYEVDPNGNIKERVLFGRTYLASGLSSSLNWSLNNGNSNLWFIQLKTAVWMQYPYNSFLKFHFSFQAGTSCRLRNMTLLTRTKYRHLS